MIRLAEVACRWRTIERDRSRSILARMGGDEFAVLLPGEAPDRAKALTEALLAAVREPEESASQTPVPRASAGISCSLGMGNGDSVEALLRRAEEAMFSAKAAGGDRYALDPQAVFVGERIANG